MIELRNRADRVAVRMNGGGFPALSFAIRGEASRFCQSVSPFRPSPHVETEFGVFVKDVERMADLCGV